MFEGYYNDRRVLVTGHTGFKGSWLSYWLHLLGAEVGGYSLYVPSEPSHYEALNLKSSINEITGDIRDVSSLKRYFNEFKPEVVFHLAAQPIVSRSFQEPTETFDTNVMGTINVLEAIREAPSVKVAVLITSDKCYENEEWAYGYREDDRLGGKDPYSASKACAEIAISSYLRSFFVDKKVKIVSVRAGNVIGGGDWAKDRIVPDCIKAWTKNEPVVIRNPVATRPWQHVLEPLSGYLWTASKLATTPNSSLTHKAYNFGPNAETNKSVGNLIDAMSIIWGGPSWANSDIPSAGSREAGLLKLCCDRALFELGWLPTLDFNETVELTTNWYKNFYLDPSKAQVLTLNDIKKYQDLAKKRDKIWIAE